MVAEGYPITLPTDSQNVQVSADYTWIASADLAPACLSGDRVENVAEPYLLSL